MLRDKHQDGVAGPEIVIIPYTVARGRGHKFAYASDISEVSVNAGKNHSHIFLADGISFPRLRSRLYGRLVAQPTVPPRQGLAPPCKSPQLPLTQHELRIHGAENYP